MLLNRERVQMLIDDLRTTRAKQGTGELRTKWARPYRNKFSYCCLGRACIIFQKETNRGKWDKGESGFVVNKSVGGYSGDHLPIPVRDWFGFYNTSVQIELDLPIGQDIEDIYANTEISLIDMNDSGFTFHQIADFLAWWLTWEENQIRESG